MRVSAINSVNPQGNAIVPPSITIERTLANCVHEPLTEHRDLPFGSG